MAESISQTKRLREITQILRKHSFISNFYHQTNPSEILATFQELGPTFIKLGQMLSTRPDLISPEYIHALRTLQDDVPADSYAIVSKIFEKSTGKRIDQVFKQFDKKPFASASVGQCHHATLFDDTKVVVKIQHSAVDQLIHVDLALFQKAIRLLKYVPGDLSVVDFNAVMNQLSASLLSEVDTLKEAKNGVKFYQLNNNDGIIQVPKVMMDMCHQKILVNQSMPGKSIKYLIGKQLSTNPEEIKKIQKTRKYVAQTLVNNFIKQVFVDHFFHADPHPGNILFYELPTNEAAKAVPKHQFTKTFGDIKINFTTTTQLPNYRLVYLDFGMMGTLSADLADQIAQVVISLTTKDNYTISQAILRVCNRTGDVNEQKFTHEFGQFITPYLNAEIANIDIAQLLFSITQLCQNNHLQLKPEVTLLFKAFGILEGTIAKLDPSLSMLEVAEPFAKQYFKDHFNLHDYLTHHLITVGTSLNALQRLPFKAERAIDSITNGNSQINLHYIGQRKVLNQLNKLLNRLLVVIMIASLLLSSSVLVVGSRDRFIYRLGVIGWIVAIVVAVILVVSNIYKTWKHRQ